MMSIVYSGAAEVKDYLFYVLFRNWSDVHKTGVCVCGGGGIRAELGHRETQFYFLDDCQIRIQYTVHTELILLT